MIDDYIEDDIEANFDIVKWHEWITWFIRAIVSISLLVALSIILKYALIEPYSIQMLELEAEFNYEPAAKKGDREI